MAPKTAQHGSESSVVNSLQIATYNIHQGFSQFNRRMVMHELRDELRAMQPDVIFLQEVQGVHLLHAEQQNGWPKESQYEFLAESIWHDFAYGKNAVYPEGHHGNAILSRFPIVRWENVDISAHPSEQRGLLHSEIRIPGWEHNLHCICVHLGLFARWRRKQLHALREHIEHLVPPNEPLVIAGDFNDWRFEACRFMVREMHLSEAFQQLHGMPACSYPSAMPVLHLDRIYVRGLRVTSAKVHSGRPWSRISDHAPLSAIISLP
ncbi:MAG: endonuclease/exonuclease/phosphatase family protein [Sulfuricella sp.]